MYLDVADRAARARLQRYEFSVQGLSLLERSYYARFQFVLTLTQDVQPAAIGCLATQQSDIASRCSGRWGD